MSKVRNENFIVIQGFMVNELNLKGNELLVYAIIYGFSQEENQVFNGSLQYLADWTNSTKQGVLKNLKSLVDKGYIKKNEKYINGVKFCEYHVTKFNTEVNKVKQDGEHSLTEGSKQSLTNNIVSNNKKNNKINIIDDLVDADDIKEALNEFLKMRKLIKKPMTDRAIKQLIKKLYSLSSNKKEQLQILDNSIINSWADIYPLKQTSRKEVVPEWVDKKEETTKPSEELSNKAEELRKRLQNS